jgi:hypothetical protein
MTRGSGLVRRAALAAAVAVLSLVVGGAFADDAVLLASTVPGYVPGMIISSADRLSVPEGASATLLFQSGEMLRVGGPFEGALGQLQVKPGQSGVSALAELFRSHGVDATVIGGTRSVEVVRSGGAIDDVVVDPQRSGTYCVEAATSVWIAHPPSEERSYAVQRKGSHRKLGWPAGAARIEWPGDVPIDDGSQFEIVTDGAARATVTFRTMPAVAGGDAGRVASGILLGCHDQFDGLLRQVSRSAVRPELWMTSDRGRRPSYSAGEAISLTIMSETDGYLYCVAAKADGSAAPVFPAGAIDGAQVHGSVALSIPGGRQPVGLRADAGLDQVRCWLADRDLTPELPHALLGAGRIPDQLASDLGGLFARVGGTRIEADVLRIRTQ